MSKKDLANMISVYGSGVAAPLFKTNDARLIQIRDSEGELLAMFFKMTDTLWGFTTVGDSDWEAHKKHLEIDDDKA